MTPDGYMTLPHDASGLSVVFLSALVFPYYDLLFSVFIFTLIMYGGFVLELCLSCGSWHHF